MLNIKSTLFIGAVCASLLTFAAEATIVKLDTSAGALYINLYDETTPLNVANFLSYVNEGKYNNTILHRLVPGFVIQGGGYAYDSSNTFDHIETAAAVNNEAKLSNVRGSIAMAKRTGLPHSATSEFFINLTANTSGGNNLDASNSGYTVFGQLTAESMVIVDQVAAAGVFDFRTEFNHGALGELPLIDYTAANKSDGILPAEDNFIIVYNATIDDAATDTAADLNPATNPNYGATPTTTSGSGGGNFGFAGLLLLAFASLFRRARFD